MQHDRPRYQTVDAKFLQAIILLLDALQIEGGCRENLKRGATSQPHDADEINTDGVVRVAVIRLLRAYIAAIGQSDRARAALLARTAMGRDWRASFRCGWHSDSQERQN